MTPNSLCGKGFGNHVKVFSENGYVALYSHLDIVYVKSGNFIKKGDLIGSQGMTGLAGENNPHLHFSVHYNWQKNGLDFWSQLAYLPPSVPFLLSYQDEQGSHLVDSKMLRCTRSYGTRIAMKAL